MKLSLASSPSATPPTTELPNTAHHNSNLSFIDVVSPSDTNDRPISTSPAPHTIAFQGLPASIAKVRTNRALERVDELTITKDVHDHLGRQFAIPATQRLIEWSGSLPSHQQPTEGQRPVTSESWSQMTPLEQRNVLLKLADHDRKTYAAKRPVTQSERSKGLRLLKLQRKATALRTMNHHRDAVYGEGHGSHDDHHERIPFTQTDHGRHTRAALRSRKRFEKQYNKAERKIAKYEGKIQQIAKGEDFASKRIDKKLSRAESRIPVTHNRSATAHAALPRSIRASAHAESQRLREHAEKVKQQNHRRDTDEEENINGFPAAA